MSKVVEITKNKNSYETNLNFPELDSSLTTRNLPSLEVACEWTIAVENMINSQPNDSFETSTFRFSHCKNGMKQIYLKIAVASDCGNEKRLRDLNKLLSWLSNRMSEWISVEKNIKYEAKVLVDLFEQLEAKQ